MPTYEYACKSCGQHVDVVQSIADEPLTVCPDCGGQLRKVFHPAGILLKGSGFYKTDNRASNGKHSGEKKDSGSNGDSSSKSSESKRSDSGGSGSSDSKSSGSGSSDTKKPAAKSA